MFLFPFRNGDVWRHGSDSNLGVITTTFILKKFEASKWKGKLEWKDWKKTGSWRQMVWIHISSTLTWNPSKFEWDRIPTDRYRAIRHSSFFFGVRGPWVVLEISWTLVSSQDHRPLFCCHEQPPGKGEQFQLRDWRSLDNYFLNGMILQVHALVYVWLNLSNTVDGRNSAPVVIFQNPVNNEIFTISTDFWDCFHQQFVFIQFVFQSFSQIMGI